MRERTWKWMLFLTYTKVYVLSQTAIAEWNKTSRLYYTSPLSKSVTLKTYSCKNEWWIKLWTAPNMQPCIRQNVCSDLIRETKICTKYVDAFQWPWRRYTSVYLKVGPSLCISTCRNYRGVPPQRLIEIQWQVDVTDGLMSAAVQSYLPFHIVFLQSTNMNMWTKTEWQVSIRKSCPNLCVAIILQMRIARAEFSY